LQGCQQRAKIAQQGSPRPSKTWEAICFIPDGRYVYVGNYSDQDFSILRVDGTKVADTGKHFKSAGSSSFPGEPTLTSSLRRATSGGAA
jgi:hypothetical protein